VTIKNFCLKTFLSYFFFIFSFFFAYDFNSVQTGNYVESQLWIKRRIFDTVLVTASLAGSPLSTCQRKLMKGQINEADT
jgi:hypothetical protein